MSVFSQFFTSTVNLQNHEKPKNRKDPNLKHSSIPYLSLVLIFFLHSHLFLSPHFLSLHLLSTSDSRKKESKMAKNMRRATKWLKGLLGMKGEKYHVDIMSTVSSDRNEKKRWSFTKSWKDTTTSHNGHVPIDSTWLRSHLAESEKEQIKHAIAVLSSPTMTLPPSPPSFTASRSAPVLALTSPPPHQPQLLPP
ncbi:hypothetical protein C1H46_011073 [Malus baccata]|uniref:Uncharacterized protein n=1 Tax=Malus baccata TaxID=106549 RepID=A0A540MX43_MALBA|nr:hypothetical protein C1H46_011073 [Malus baccata]